MQFNHEQLAGLDRRTFLKFAVSSGFALGMFPELTQSGTPSELKPYQQPSAFVSIVDDGTITVTIGKTDIGQGVHTALPMLIAEELDADWSKVRCELAPAGEAYKDPVQQAQVVGGSTSMKNSWIQYREIGARMRAMLMSAAAKRFQVPAALLKTEASAVITSDGRRASYGELALAAFSEPVPESVQLKSPLQFKLIGMPTGRLDARDKSSGRQKFGIDLLMPDMRTALVLHPPVFGAKVARFDAAPAKVIAGIEDVYLIPLADGGSGLAIVANGFWPARTARELLQVEWDTRGLEKVDSDVLLARYRELAMKPGTKAQAADTSALASASHKIIAEYHFPYLAHTPMEPLNCAIDYRGDRCTVWAGSQFQTMHQAAVAAVLGMKPDAVVFNTMMAGGGFGRRAVGNSDFIFEAAQVAKARHAAGRRGPVKLVWTREDDVRGGSYRPMHVHRAEIGHDGKGNVLAWKHVIVGQSIMSGGPFEPYTVKNGVDSTMTEGLAESAYPFPIALEVHHPKVNVPVWAYRSVGHSHNAYVMETLVDELARAAGRDPVEYRHALLHGRPRHLAALDLAVRKAGYGKRQLGAGRAWGVSVHEAFDTVIAYVVEASMLQGRPRVHTVTAGVHCNLAINPRTIEAQVQGGMMFGLGTTLPGAHITLKDGEVQQSNWHDYRLATHADTPDIAVHIAPSTDPPTGIGECAVPAIAPAVANAVAALTGQRHRSLPFEA